MDDFSKAPKSVAEARAERTESTKSWTPRDALVSILREIDAGRLDAKTVFIAYRDESTERTHFVAAGPSSVEIIGTTHLAISRFMAG